MGMDFCLPCESNKDAVPRATAAKRRIRRLARAALKAKGDRPLVDALADGSLEDADVDLVIRDLAQPRSPYWTTRMGPTTYNYTAASRAPKRPECWWPALEHFRVVLAAEPMRFEVQLQPGKNKVAGKTNKNMCPKHMAAT
jgi:hypothetical protein